MRDGPSPRSTWRRVSWIAPNRQAHPIFQPNRVPFPAWKAPISSQHLRSCIATLYLEGKERRAEEEKRASLQLCLPSVSVSLSDPRLLEVSILDTVTLLGLEVSTTLLLCPPLLSSSSQPIPQASPGNGHAKQPHRETNASGMQRLAATGGCIDYAVPPYPYPSSITWLMPVQCICTRLRGYSRRAPPMPLRWRRRPWCEIEMRIHIKANG
ncbi:hypothetical protein R3P38DRAFT_3208668 [Favolaschia claudopus]|uniref:Uncharacterized protein n=1 Tax=Favolaschia claudopus TaxID=2862362 RepID=A0AAW0AIX8_9AGAR